ncbi:alpha/beta fold hydrolase [Saccharothrix sp.]|uniref:alpha/beta fold hydrolase n=1 Tax=Saccharothrix sp. TaxID=1873460 RepID=UPI002810AD78|nr:alpha/beta fold hydrolase [Saccharothrix sp.]
MAIWHAPAARRPKTHVRWIAGVVGALCVLLGAVLVAHPFRSVAVLVLLVAVGMAVAGLGELASARASAMPRVALLVGVAWVVAGLLVILLPGVAIGTITVLAGVALIVAGVVDVVTGLRGAADQRVTVVVRGVAAVVFGVLALSWPDITEIVVAVVFGARLVLVGVDLVATAVRPGHGKRVLPRWTRTVAAVCALVVAVALLVVSVRVHGAAPRPDAFYDPPSDAPTTPGLLLRSEPFTRGVPAGARAWRILYTTTRDEGVPATASGLVLAPENAPPGPRPVIAWAHGTTGATPGCAPSLAADPFGPGAIPAAAEVLARGWVVVATDYPGLGTAGPHPYLIGQGEARSVLDAVRAARHLGGVDLAERTVVWGHSQGGHAALWTGILAPTYAPQTNVLGVAALAPASDLSGLVDNLGGLRQATVLAAYVIESYSEIYPDVDYSAMVRPTARLQAREMAGRCLTEPSITVTVMTSLLFDRPIWNGDPTSGAFGARLRENTPTGPIPAPLLVAQGGSDPLILPSVQDGYVRRRCATGGVVDHRTYPGRDHLGVVAPDSPLLPELLAWTQDRLDNRPAPTTCPT